MTDARTEIIDSHQHFWQLSRGDYSWLTPELSELYSDFLPTDYIQVAGKNLPSNTVLVQAADSDEETDFLLQLASENELVSGVVGWVQFDGISQIVVERLKQLSVNPFFKGVRPMLQDIEDVEWILNPAFNPTFECLVNLDLSFDALVKTEHLKTIYTLANRHPKLKIVIDHCAKPNITENEFQLWADELAVFKPLTNVYIKVSGLTTEANADQQSSAHFQHYFDHVYQTFGASRMMWGSDWPVVNLKSNYSDWLTLSQTLVSDLSEQEKERFWCGTANEFYQLNR